MRKIILVICLLSSIALASLGETSYAPFANENLKQLWNIPVDKIEYQVIKTYSRGKTTVNEIYYISRPFNRVPTKIFGYYCFPSKKNEKLPAVILSHGGGGHASLPYAIYWAKRGYAALVIDLPGKGENRALSRSTGPDMVVANLLKTQPDLSHNYLIHAVAAIRNGITFLTKQKEVDPERIGMIGLSWGGVLTILTNGQDDRLKAAVNVFGAGFIPEGCTWEKWFTQMPALDKKLWDENLDPKNFLAMQHAPILFITGTNDHCYYLPTFQKSYAELGSIEAKILLVPNLRHRFLASSLLPASAWIDDKIKNKKTSSAGWSYPTITFETCTLEGKNILISVKAIGRNKIKSGKIYYSLGGPYQWTTRKWKEIPSLKHKDNIYYFSIPAKFVAPEIMFYVSARDNKNGEVSTLVRSIFAVKFKNGGITYALSSPIMKMYRHEAPIKLFNGKNSDDYYFSCKKGDKYFQALDKK
ncbi:MAG: acetylxylan esterase [Candidatus Margulisiibacteriota bacterium]